ncbi:MAG TPA: hypothetical protein DCG38_12715 [Eubacteriaceae bacterium]|jgi:uncharacterized integral membrane protein|nr:hypothetical protein [Eubacteriaceae bacterium]
MQAGFIVSILFAIIVTVFALQNAQPVDVKFFTFHGQASLALVILISVAFGAAILGVFNFYGRLKYSREVKKLQKKVTALESDLESCISEKDALSASNQQSGYISEKDASTEKSFEPNQNDIIDNEEIK